MRPMPIERNDGAAVARLSADQAVASATFVPIVTWIAGQHRGTIPVSVHPRGIIVEEAGIYTFQATALWETTTTGMVLLQFQRISDNLVLGRESHQSNGGGNQTSQQVTAYNIALPKGEQVLLVAFTNGAATTIKGTSIDATSMTVTRRGN